MRLLKIENKTILERFYNHDLNWVHKNRLCNRPFKYLNSYDLESIKHSRDYKQFRDFYLFMLFCRCFSYGVIGMLLYRVFIF